MGEFIESYCSSFLTMIWQCILDSWSVGVSSNSTPSAVIAGLSLENFCLLKFYVHKPAEPLQFDFTFHEYRLEVYMDQTFAMFLRLALRKRADVLYRDSKQ